MEVSLEVVEGVLDSTLEQKGSTFQFVHKLVEGLLDELPHEFITKDFVMDMIIDRLTDSLHTLPDDREELVESYHSIQGPMSEEMKAIMLVILDKVFGIGVDYLYIVNDPYRVDHGDTDLCSCPTTPKKAQNKKNKEDDRKDEI